MSRNAIQVTIEAMRLLHSGMRFGIALPIMVDTVAAVKTLQKNYVYPLPHNLDILLSRQASLIWGR